MAASQALNSSGATQSNPLDLTDVGINSTPTFAEIDSDLEDGNTVYLA